LPGFSLGENFADADDGDEAVLEGGFEFLVDELVGFAEVLAALGVAEDDMRGADGFEHQRRGFAGVGALVGEVHVLRTDGDPGTGGGRDYHRDRGKGGANDDLVAVVVGDQGEEVLHELLGLGGGFIHFSSWRRSAADAAWWLWLLRVIVEEGLWGYGDTEHRVQGTAYSVQCSVFSVQCSVFSVQCSVFSVQCSVFSGWIDREQGVVARKTSDSGLLEANGWSRMSDKGEGVVRVS